MFCNLLEQIDRFLLNELEEERSLSARKPHESVQILKSLEKDDLHYALLNPSKGSSRFEDGSWVEVHLGDRCLFASLWLSDEERPYLLSNEPLSGTVRIAEADGIQLLEMQKQALSRLKMKTTEPARNFYDAIQGDCPKEWTVSDAFQESVTRSCRSQSMHLSLRFRLSWSPGILGRQSFQVPSHEKLSLFVGIPIP